MQGYNEESKGRINAYGFTHTYTHVLARSSIAPFYMKMSVQAFLKIRWTTLPMMYLWSIASHAIMINGNIDRWYTLVYRYVCGRSIILLQRGYYVETTTRPAVAVSLAIDRYSSRKGQTAISAPISHHD